MTVYHQNFLQTMTANICILHFSSLQVWVTSCFAMKLQFTDVQAYLNEVERYKDPSTYITIKGNLLKRVADWHNEICGALTKQFVKDCTPDFVTEAIDSAKQPVPNNSEEQSNICDPFNLHVALLKKASEMMIACVGEVDLSQWAVSAIRNWFELLESPEFDKFLQSSQGYVRLKAEMTAVRVSYYCASDPNTIGSGVFGEFFEPNTLFLYLAHAVFMECYDPSFVSIVQMTHKGITGDNRSEHTLAWQNACGYLVRWKFSIGSFKGMTGPDNMEFPILNVLKPISTVVEAELRNQKGPPVHSIHLSILESMSCILTEKAQKGGLTLQQEETAEFGMLNNMCNMLHTRTCEQMGKISNREKANRSSQRKGVHRFRIDRKFNNDLFLMGDVSFGNIIKGQKNFGNTIKGQKKAKERDELRDELENLFLVRYKI